MLGLKLTHWGRVTHVCVGNLTIIGSDNGLSPGRRQAITWTNVETLLIEPLGTNFNEMLIEIHTLSLRKIHLKMSSGKWRPFCLGLNVLRLLSKEGQCCLYCLVMSHLSYHFFSARSHRLQTCSKLHCSRGRKLQLASQLSLLLSAATGAQGGHRWISLRKATFGAFS